MPARRTPPAKPTQRRHTPKPIQTPPERLYTDRDLDAWLKLDRSTRYRMRKRKEFPEPVRLTSNRNAWRESDIVRWMQERLARAS
jgi:predicted DNA-binding transcriptional regulator AlpA